MHSATPSISRIPRSATRPSTVPDLSVTAQQPSRSACHCGSHWAIQAPASASEPKVRRFHCLMAASW